MTIWNHSISWSKLKLALECPYELQLTIDKAPHGKAETSYYAHLGKMTQKTFELYFDQQINLKKGGQDSKIILKAADRVLPHYVKNNQISYSYDQTEEGLLKEARTHVEKGFEVMAGMGLLNHRVRSEVKLNGVFRGLRMFALVDFMVELKDGDLLYDGKGHREKNADPRQVVYYALNRAAAGRKVSHAGLIYWQHGFEEIDTSPAALRNFVDTDLAKARPVLELLKHGTNHTLPTDPSPAHCKHCLWNRTCKDSYYLRPERIPEGDEEIGFGEATTV